MPMSAMKARFINKEGRDDFRNLYYLKNKINARHTYYNHGWRRRLPLLANVNPRLPKAVYRCDGW